MKFTIGKKLGLSFGGAFALIVIAVLVACLKLGGISNDQAELLSRRLPAVDAGWDLRVALQSSAAQTRGYMLVAGSNAEEAAKLKQNWETTWNRINDDISKLKELSPHFAIAENKTRIAELILIKAT